MSKLEDAIRQAINASSLTRYAIWKRTGIDQAQLSRFVHGQSGLSFEAIDRLMEVLDLEIEIRPRGARLPARIRTAAPSGRSRTQKQNKR